MSILVQALALLPAVAAIIVVLTAIADRREASALNGLHALHLELDTSLADVTDTESCAACTRGAPRRDAQLHFWKARSACSVRIRSA